MMDGREPNPELRIAWEFVEKTGRSIFLTGKAGTGKTTFLKAVVQRSTKRSIVVAPTGVAAINAGGVTIHSFFQLPFSPYIPDTHIKSKFEFGREKRSIIASLDLLIIDEISMVRADLLDAIDSVLRRFRNRHLPFGGVQLLMIGDLNQLTPVTTPEDEQLLAPYYETPYFFSSKALQQLAYVTIQLEHVYRQKDETFIRLLNHIRDGEVSAEDLQQLNSRYIPGFVPQGNEGFIRLTTHNHLASAYNAKELEKLETSPFQYQAHIEGTFPEYSYPTAESLTLKVGAQVMFVKNDPSGLHRYFNGRIGRVVRTTPQDLDVLCVGDSKPIHVEPLEWENLQYTLNEETHEIESSLQGKFRQYPLRLAWAITIHKSQGLTFDRAIIEANHSFSPGQVYVALSRCRTLEGMVLAAPLDSRAVMTDSRVEDYIIHQSEEAQRSIENLPQLREEYYARLLMELFDFSGLLYLSQRITRLMDEYFYHSHPHQTETMRKGLASFKEKVSDIADKWRQQMMQMDSASLHADPFLERVQRSAAYFERALDESLSQAVQEMKSVESGNKQVMKRFGNAVAEWRTMWLARRQLLLKMADTTFEVGIYLFEKQHTLLDAMDETSLSKAKRKRKGEKKVKEAKPKTWELSYDLFRQGLTPRQIAEQRGLTLYTIYTHLKRYLIAGELKLTDIIPAEKCKIIQGIIKRLSADAPIKAVKAFCPSNCTYDEIRLVMECR